MKPVILSMTLVFSAFSLVAADAWFSWQKDAGGNASGNIGDVAHWNKDPAGSTQASDYLQFGLENTDYTVTIPSGTTHETMMRPFITGRAGYKVTFDGENATWLQPVSTHGNYSTPRLHFRLGTTGISNSDIFRIENTSANTVGGFRMSDVLFTVDGTVAPDFHVDFSRGTYNFYDPNGTALTQLLYVCGESGDSARNTTVRFSGTSSFAVAKVRFGNGGWLRTLEITGGATGEIGANGVELYGADTKGGVSVIHAHDGGTLTMGGNVELINSHTFRLLAESGATLSIPASKTFSFGSAAAQAAYDGLLVVSNATLSGASGSTYKPYGKSRFYGATVSVPTFSPYAKTVLVDSQVDVQTFSPYAEAVLADSQADVQTFSPFAEAVVSNSQITATTLSTATNAYFYDSQVSVTTLSPTNAKAYFRGSDVTVGTFTPSAETHFEDGSVIWVGRMQPSDATVVFKDSVVTSAFDDVRYASTVVIDGGSYVSTNAFRFNYTGSGATLVLTNGGEFVFTPNSELNFMQSSGASGSILVRGGKLKTTTGSKELRISPQGSACTEYIELSSGEIAIGNRSLRVGKGGAYAGPNVEMLVSGGKYSGASMFFTSAANSADKVSYLRQTGGEIMLSGGFHAVTNYPGRTLLKLEGGTFKASLVYGGLDATANGGAGYAMLEANGGTLIPSASPDAAGFIRGFDSAKIGASGLVVDAVSNILIPQAFADMDGENGELVLAGSATKTISGSSTVSKIVAAGGRIVFADGQSTTSSLLVTNGAEVAFASSAAGSSISGVTFGDDSSTGVLVATPGVTPAINGTVDAVNLRVTLANGFSNYTTNAIISADAFTARALDAIARAVASAGLPAGAAASFTVEDVAGRKVLKMALTDPEVLVIRVDEGTSNIASAVTYPVSGQLQTLVAVGATLDISGNVGYGSLLNSGDGVLRLSGDNAFYGDIVSAGGTFRASPFSSLSCGDSVEKGMFTLQSGTLELSDTASPATFPREIRTDAASGTDAVVIKTDTDVVIPDANGFAAKGAVIKRGAGSLTVTTGKNGLPLASGLGLAGKNKYASTTDTLEFGADGKPAGTYYAALSVVEGDLSLVGTGENASFVVTNIVAVGQPCLTGTATPSLTIRDTTFLPTWLLLAGGLSSDNTFIASPPQIYATNSTIELNTYATAYRSKFTAVKPKMTLDASVMTLDFLFRANGADLSAGGVEAEYSLVNGSVLTTPRIGVSHKASFDCDASTIDVRQLFCKSTSYNYESGYVYVDSYAIFKFRNGSLFKTDYVEPSRSASTTSPLTFEFDDSEWRPIPGETADYTFAFTNAFNFLVKADAGGLVLSPGEGRTWSVVHPVTGADGKIVKRGAGTLAFTGDGALAVGGTNEVEAGVFAVAATSTVYGVKAHVAAGATLDLLGGAHAHAVLSGAGEVRNGTLSDAVLRVDVMDGVAPQTPVLAFDDGLALSGTLTFDLCRNEANPIPTGASVVVCRYTGTPSAGVAYRLRGTGVSGARGEFTVADGTVTLDIRPPRGCAISFR